MKSVAPIGIAIVALAQAVLPAATSASNSAAPIAPISPALTPPSGTFPVSMTVSVDLHAMHPLAQKAALHCGAVAASLAAARSNALQIQDNWSGSLSNQAAFDKFNQLILAPANYNRADTSVDIPLVNRGYNGTLTVTVHVPSAGLINPAQHMLFADPGVLAGCWLMINGVAALQVSGVEIATANNVNHVSQQPYFAAAQAVTAL